MSETPDQQPRIPGVRYRKMTRTRWVETTFNGETKLREQEYDAWVPVPPRNLDVLYLRAVITVAVFLTVVAVVWSTMAIGRLLGALVPEYPAVGYLGACSFELPWVTCLLVQWVLRHQPERAKAVSIAGWIGLGIVVSAIITDGRSLGTIEVGIVGAFVSVMAKGLWWVVLRLYHVPLSEDAAGWLQASREEMSVARVMLDEQQRMAGQQAYLAHVYGLGPGVMPAVPAARAQLPAAPKTVPAVQAQAPAASGQRAASGGREPSAAVQEPATPTTPPHPSGQPSIHVPPPTAAPSGHPVPPQSGHPDDASGQGAPEKGPAEEPVVPPVVPIGASMAATIRNALDVDRDISDEALTALVKSAHGDRPRLAETVRRTRDREEQKRRRAG